MKTAFTALLAAVGGVAAAASVFFCYYTLRLVYLEANGMIDAAHRTAGIRIGAAVFPVAAFTLGWLSLICIRSASRRFRRA